MSETIKNLLNPFVELKINGSKDIGDEILALEWKAFVNGGYIVRAKVSDVFFRALKKVVTKKYLNSARNEPTKCEFKIGWSGGKPGIHVMPDSRIAFISDLDQYGTSDVAQFEFVAVDPPSYFLNAGKGSGKVYKGNISKVIKQVVGEYAPNLSLNVTETNDSKSGLWPMMRQDPKTFIQSLIDWSADLNPNKTQWIITTKDNELYIKEQKDMLSNKIHYGNFNVSFGGDRPNDIRDYSLLTNNFLSVYQTGIVTQGISTVSGKFIDRKTDKDKVEINDDNTGSKINTRIDESKGFSKPKNEWLTSINAIPEHSAGDVGVRYEDYIGGRARQLYLSMLPMVMRLKITLDGTPKFDDPSKLGVSTLTLNWKDLDDKDFFLAGKWIVYGFHHKVMTAGVNNYPDWSTDVYVYRIDYNANAEVI